LTRKPATKIGRRQFLTGAAATATLTAASSGAPPDAEWRNKQSGMTYRRLGRTGFMVSSMGMGGNDIRPDNSDHVLYAIDHGINYFDTSPTYGRGLSEAGYGAAIKARGRGKMFITSKVPDDATRDTQAYQDIFESLPASEQAKYRSLVREKTEESGALEPDYAVHYFGSQLRRLRREVLNSLLAEKYADRIQPRTRYREEIIASVEASLKRLGTDYLDCLLAPHGTDTPYHVTNHPEVFEAFETLRKQGKVRHFGLSAHSDPGGVLSAAIDSGQYSMAMIAYNFINHRFVDAALEKAREADFGVTVMKASRGIQNPFQRSRLVTGRVKAVNELVPGEDLSPFQKGFKWVLGNENISTIAAGMANMEETKQDVPLGMKGT